MLLSELRRSLCSPYPTSADEQDRNVYTPNFAVDSSIQILVIDQQLPTPDRDSGSVRMLEMIRAFRRRGHRVTFVPGNWMIWPNYIEPLQVIGVEVIQPACYRSVEEFLVQRGREFDLAIISRAIMAAKHMAIVRKSAPQAKIVFDTVDLHFLREARQVVISQDKSQVAVAALRKQQELQLARQADLTLVVSPIEKAILEAESSELDVRVLPNIVPIERRLIPGFEGRSRIIFIGSFLHPPNVDAVLHFAGSIFPKVLNRLPEAIFQIIGPYPPPEVEDLASPRIEVLGHVPDVRPMFDRARVAVAPLRFGAGVKGKVNQSMALGVPTVVTSVAAEGMYLAHEATAMIADDPDRFADAVIRLWSSRDLWHRLSTNGLASVEQHFSVEAASQTIDDLLEWARSTSPVRSHSPNPQLVANSR